MNEKPEPATQSAASSCRADAIEVIRFHDAETHADAGLHICPECTSELVQPVAWSEVSDGALGAELYCPNCGGTPRASYDQDRSPSSRSSSTRGSRRCSATCSD